MPLPWPTAPSAITRIKRYINVALQSKGQFLVFSFRRKLGIEAIPVVRMPDYFVASNVEATGEPHGSETSLTTTESVIFIIRILGVF